MFIDDSPLELAEVKSHHPGIECLLFPSESDNGVYQLLEDLRCRFGKDHLSHEDVFRSASLRTAQEFQETINSADPDEFLLWRWTRHFVISWLALALVMPTTVAVNVLFDR